MKAMNAQSAGAIGVIVADSMPGCPALGMSGVAPSVTIPVVRITTDDGARLKAALLVGPVNVTLRVDPAIKAGADNAGHPLVYTPLPYTLGSSVSHWDISAPPDLLMEPALNPGLSSDPDLTVAQFSDIGWFAGPVGVGHDVPSRIALEASFPNPTAGASTISYSLAAEQDVRLAVYDLTGRVVARLVQGRVSAGRHSVQWDGTDLAGRRAAPGIYQYRLWGSSLDESRHIVIVR
jgi:membrane-associated phospholipid phosphatase